jgi:hypothetical protein
VELSTESPINLDAVEAICCLPDDLYRLRWVSYAYHDIAKRLAVGLGENASWPTFARWSAFTISEALRLDQVNPRLEEVLRDHSLPERFTGPLVSIQKQLRNLDDGAMPVVLALGNRMVFHEVGWTMIKFLTWIEGLPKREDKAWKEYRAGITAFKSTDFFRPSYLEWLRDGVSAYHDAWWEPNPAKKAQSVLRGNILIGAYEQWRVDSFFEVALDFNPGALITDLRVGKHDEIGTRPVGVRHAGTRRALRHQWALLNWMSDAYAAFLTRFVLTWDAPLFSESPTALRLGSDIPSRRDAAVYAKNLDKLDSDVQKLFDTFDRSDGRLQGSGARNFRRFTDRMSFIVNLFRSQQQNENLRVTPSDLDLRLLELQLNDHRLDELRGIGDARGKELIARVPQNSRNPQALSRGFVVRGEPYQILRNDQLQINFPPWVKPAKIRQGQEFFKANKMEICAALFCASLPMTYTAARGARVLVETAELVSDVRRRIEETGRLLFDVMSPDPTGLTLTPGSKGYTTVLAVRGFHAAIRKMLAEQEPWKSAWTVPMTHDESGSVIAITLDESEDVIAITLDESEDAAPDTDPRPEVPINQEDLLGTLAAFTVVVIESLAKMGVKVSDEERDAYLHTWLAVGYLLGIDYDLLRVHPLKRDLEPLTYFEMQLLKDAIFRRQAAPSPSGQILTRALIGLQEAALPRVLRPLPPAAIRRFIGDHAADMLEVPPAGPVRVLLNAFGPAGSGTDWIKQGSVMRPQLRDMASQMYLNWMPGQPSSHQDWSAEGLAAAFHGKADVDLVENDRPAANAIDLWEDRSLTLPPRDTGRLTSTS